MRSNLRKRACKETDKKFRPAVTPVRETYTIFADGSHIRLPVASVIEVPRPYIISPLPMHANPSLINTLTQQAVDLLQQIICLPAPSREEGKRADFIEHFMREKGLQPHRHGHNLWSLAAHWDPQRPTLLLNAHIDTVHPVAGWTREPFSVTREGERLYGLGTNDCGGGLASLLCVFAALHREPRTAYNLVFLASAEEEVSGRAGIESVLPLLPPIDLALVGEPTGRQPAIAEKGLMVLDCTAHGRSGHAAREEGINALYEALPDIAWIQQHHFPKISPLLGAVKATVTMIQAGTQHNVIPDTCTFTVDVRSNELYSNAELLTHFQENLKAEVKARSTRLGSSGISAEHPLVQRIIALGRQPYGSPTLSDQALMPWPSFKFGPGESARSHTADEYIETTEIRGFIEDLCHILTE